MRSLRHPRFRTRRQPTKDLPPVVPAPDAPARERCTKCRAVLPPDGRCIRCVSTKPWMRRCWKDRRDVVVARTQTCEWCTASFEKANPAHVHHVVERYSLGPGDVDWYSYMLLIDEDVEIICAACHRTWSQLGKRRVPPRPCSECAEPTSAPGGVCSNACYRTRLRRENPQKADFLEWRERSEILDRTIYEECRCTATCRTAFYYTKDGGGGGPVAECILRSIETELPGYLTWEGKTGEQ